MVAIPTSQKRPFIPAPGVMQAEMIYSQAGMTYENVYHVLQGDGATPPTLAQMNALAAALKGWENVTASQYRSNGVSMLSIIVRDLTTQSSPAITYTTGLPINGTKTTQALPGNVTAAVKWNTALRGRSYRGRSYIIGLCADQIDRDWLTPAAQTALQTAHNTLITNVNAVAGCQLVVLSFAHNNFWRGTAVATVVTAATLDIALDSQRRRLSGRGK